jgi:hypothetical protein
MEGQMGRRPDRLGPLQLVGAWLGLWTPPRGVEVPRAPWRAIAAGAAALAVLLGVAAAVLLPRLAGERDAQRERELRAESRRHAEFLASVDREQIPREGRGPTDPGAGVSAAEPRVAARRRLLTAAERHIERDAGGRTDKAIRGVDCSPFPRTLDGAQPTADLARAAATFDCVAVTSRFGSEEQAGGRGIIGMPFRLLLDFERGRYAFCRIVPLGDEDRLSHPLPRACRLSARQDG